MQVKAVGFRGQLHSVFGRVVNVLGDGQLVSIADAPIGDLPNGVQVQLDAGYGFRDAGLRPDMVIVGDGAHLIVDGGTLTVDLSHAAVIPARKVIEGRLLPWSERLANLRMAQERGMASASGAGLGPFWSGLDAVMAADLPNLLAAFSASSLCGAAAGPLCELVAGLRLGDIARAANAEERLVGLGIGLTPSCDDVLTGMMGAMAILGDALGLAEYLAPLLDATASAAKGHTHIIAWTYIQRAVRGEVSSALANYIIALSTGSAPDIEVATRNLFAVGGTSGMELALGAAIGVWLLVCEECRDVPGNMPWHTGFRSDPGSLSCSEAKGWAL